MEETAEQTVGGKHLFFASFIKVSITRGGKRRWIKGPGSYGAEADGNDSSGAASDTNVSISTVDVIAPSLSVRGLPRINSGAVLIKRFFDEIRL